MAVLKNFYLWNKLNLLVVLLKVCMCLGVNSQCCQRLCSTSLYELCIWSGEQDEPNLTCGNWSSFIFVMAS